MKRYRMFGVLGASTSNPIGRLPCEMLEQSDGEWVRWEDHKNKFFRFMEIYESQIRELKDEIKRLKTTTIIRKEGTEKAKKVTECNCSDAIDSWWDQWVCPAHGYKR